VSPTEDPVHLAQSLHEGGEVLDPLADPIRELGQDPQDFLFLGSDHFGQLVVGVNHGLRLDEERPAALRAIVHDSAHTVPGIGAQRNHVAAMPHGHEAVARGLDVLKHPFELTDDPAAPVPRAAPELPEARAGPVGHGSVVIQRASKSVTQLGRARECPHQSSELRTSLLDPAPVSGELRACLDKRKDLNEFGAIEDSPRQPDAIEDCPDVDDGV
jgi:hypothetical protein